MFIEKIKHFIISIIIFLKQYFHPSKDIEHTEIPIIINNFNRLTYLKILISGLEKRGYKNIYILDNQSTYKPLLDFYKETPHKVVMLEKNYGFRALWKSGLYKKFIQNYFVYTDSDLEIIKECPNDFLEHFRKQLIKNKLAFKVGFSLKIDDLPDDSPLKTQVLNWETKFYCKPTRDGQFFKAPIDTTFALYKPFSFKHVRSPQALTYRANYPYQMKHLPWYITADNISDEDYYYLKTTNDNSTWFQKLNAK